MRFLFYDDRPELPDTELWNRLLKIIHKLEDRKTAELLQKRLWTMRSIGTMIRRTHLGSRFEPIIHEHSGWDSVEFFNELKKQYLLPYEKEIKWLLDNL